MGKLCEVDEFDHCKSLHGFELLKFLDKLHWKCKNHKIVHLTQEEAKEIEIILYESYKIAKIITRMDDNDK